jgi:hypothetical protein
MSDETMGDLGTSPDEFASTRDTLRRVAGSILARRRSALTGRIGLRASPGGLATPASGPDDEVIRTDGAALIVERGGVTTVSGLTTLRAAADHVGVDLDSPVFLGADAPPPGDPDTPLRIDDRSARELGAWFIFATTVLDGVLAHLGPSAQASVIQLWPEHFDVACDVAWGDGERQRVNLGASPGDNHHPRPYLYVGPWGPERPGQAGYWNAPFGATLDHRALRPSGAGGNARAIASDFLIRGFDLLASPGGRNGLCAPEVTDPTTSDREVAHVAEDPYRGVSA